MAGMNRKQVVSLILEGRRRRKVRTRTRIRGKQKKPAAVRLISIYTRAIMAVYLFSPYFAVIKKVILCYT